MAAKKASAKSMSKAEIVDSLSDSTELSKKDVTTVIDGLADLIADQLGKSGPGVFNIPGLIKVSRHWKEKTPAREGRNPATGEPMMYKSKPAHYTVKVKALKGLLDTVADLKKKID